VAQAEAVFFIVAAQFDVLAIDGRVVAAGTAVHATSFVFSHGGQRVGLNGERLRVVCEVFFMTNALWTTYLDLHK